MKALAEAINILAQYAIPERVWYRREIPGTKPPVWWFEKQVDAAKKQYPGRPIYEIHEYVVERWLQLDDTDKVKIKTRI